MACIFVFILHFFVTLFIQVIQWKALDEDVLPPVEWGWYDSEKGMQPIKTWKEIAPAEIIKVIKCNCKLSSKNPCGTNLCSCRKNGIKCMPACGNCHGNDCNNKSVSLKLNKNYSFCQYHKVSFWSQSYHLM